VTLAGFGTHLRAYLGLFQVLPQFEFIYIAPSARLFQAAESEFHHLLRGRRGPSKSVNILDYFRLRKAWDRRERVASADVVLLKEAQQCFAGSNTEELYEKWLQGVVGDDDVTRDGSHATALRKATFRTLMCGSSLRVFSNSLEGDVETWLERDTVRDAAQVSSDASIQVSGS
jgi:hypothetical protein